MKKFEEKDSDELKAYLKENFQTDDFLHQITEDPKTTLRLMLRVKFLPESLYHTLTLCESRAIEVIEIFREFNFIPGHLFLELLYQNQYEEAIINLIRAFSTLEILMEDFVSLLNNEKYNVCHEMMLVKPDKFLKKDFVLTLILKGHCSEMILNFLPNFAQDLIIDLYLDNEENEENEESEINPKIIEFILKKNFKKIISKIMNPELYSYVCTSRLFNAANDEFLKTSILEQIIENEKLRTKANWISPVSIGLEYHPLFEKTELKDFNLQGNPGRYGSEDKRVVLKLLNVPEESKHRERYIKFHPNKATIAEITASERHFMQYASVSGESFFLNERPLSEVKLFKQSWIKEYTTPSQFDKIADPEVCNYLYSFLPGSFRKRLKKRITVDSEIVAVKEKGKKSYFFEVVQSIEEANIENFRKYTSMPSYNLEKFITDTNQKSKADLTSYLPPAIYQHLTKEEYIHFVVETELLSFGRWEKIILPFKFSVSEIFQMLENNTDGRDYLIEFCDDIISLMKLKIKNHFYHNIFIELFLSNNDHLEKTPAKIKEDALDILIGHYSQENSFTGIDESNSSFDILKYLDKKTIRKALGNEASETLSLGKTLSLKDKNDEYVFEIDELPKIIKAEDFSKYNVEESLEAIRRRDRGLFKQIAEIYLKGGPPLAKIAKGKVTRNSSNLERIKFLYETSDLSNVDLLGATIDQVGIGSAVQKIRSRSGLFSLNDYRDYFQNHTGPKIAIELDDLDLLIEIFQENPGLSEKIEIRPFDLCWYIDIQRKVISFIIEQKICCDFLDLNLDSAGIEKVDNSLDNLLKLIQLGANCTDDTSKFISIAYLNRRHEIDDSDGSSLLSTMEKLGPDFIRQVISSGYININSVYLSHLIDNNSSRYNDIFCQLIKNNKDKRPIILLDNNSSFRPETEIIDCKNDKSAFEFELLKYKMREGDRDFASFSICKFSVKIKTDLINFIIKEIDPRFKKLKLLEKNLNGLTVICNYDEFEKITPDPNNNDKLLKLLLIPDNFKNNRKIIKGLTEIISLKGVSVIHKIQSFQSVASFMSTKAKIDCYDIFDFSDVDDIKLTDEFDSIDHDIISSLVELYKQNPEANICINRDKKETLRFLRSLDDKDQIKDSVDMIKVSLVGLENLRESYREEQDEDLKIQIKSTMDNVESWLAEIRQMDDIEHIHDRLVVVSSFVTSDPTISLGQTNYDVINSSKLEKEIGYSLFFPKTIGELTLLGDYGGWCVNRSRSYSEGVINNKEILVSLCPGNGPSIENSTVLLHLKRAKEKDISSYYCDQIKGKNNQEAPRGININLIVSQIVSHLIKLNKK